MQVGDRIEDFSAMSSSGLEVHYRDLKDKPLLLYFYPKDSTPGCTQQACDMRDSWSSLSSCCRVLGVSRDSVKSHQNFIEKYSLPFELLSDSEEILCKLFDVIKEKSLYGKKYMGIERSSFLIDQEGVVVRAWRKVNVGSHLEQVTKALKELGLCD